MQAPQIEGMGYFYIKRESCLLITDNFQKSSDFFDQ